MSREVKYIGMDVHKEAIVIAVLNTRGHMVMESIVETKANSILQFIHGLQGDPSLASRACRFFQSRVFRVTEYHSQT